MKIFRKKCKNLTGLLLNIRIIISVHLHCVWETSVQSKRIHTGTLFPGPWALLSSFVVPCFSFLILRSGAGHVTLDHQSPVCPSQISKHSFPHYRCPLISWGCCNSGGPWMPRKISSFYSNSFRRNLLIYQVSIFGFL